MSKIDISITKRFAELVAQADQIGRYRGEYADPQAFYAWAASALHALQGVFGKDSPYRVRFQQEIDGIVNNHANQEKLAACKGIVRGAKADLDGGYLFNFHGTVSAEIFGDFITTAKAALAEGRHTVAAVLGCAALEDALKEYAARHQLDVMDKTMEEVVNALKTKGLVSGTQKGLLAAMPKIRNHAMHAEWEKITPQDAGSVIGFVEQFLLTHFP